MAKRKARDLKARLAAGQARIQQLEQQLSNSSVVTSNDREALYELFHPGPSAAGPVVNASTAMRASAVYASVALLAGAIAALPLPIFRRQGDSRERADHPYWWMLNEQPTPTFSACAFWEYLISCKLLRGDAFAWIVRNGAGVPVELIPVPRNQVIVERRNGRNRYYIELDDQFYGLEQEDMLHFHSLGFDGVRSPSVIGLAGRQSIGVSLAADEYAGRFFANGARPDIALKHPGNPTPDQVRLLRDTWLERHQGTHNSHLPALLTGGMDISQITLSAEDSQLLETRRWQVVEIARIFGVPPHLIGETSAATSWGSGIEQLGIGFVRWTLNRHLRPIEQELNRKLWPSSTRYFCEFNREGLMAGDSAAEAAYFSTALGGPGSQGYMTINEVRRIKNLPPIDGGDRLYQTDTSNAQPTAQPDPQQPADPRRPADS